MVNVAGVLVWANVEQRKFDNSGTTLKLRGWPNTYQVSLNDKTRFVPSFRIDALLANVIIALVLILSANLVVTQAQDAFRRRRNPPPTTPDAHP